MYGASEEPDGEAVFEDDAGEDIMSSGNLTRSTRGASSVSPLLRSGAAASRFKVAAKRLSNVLLPATTFLTTAGIRVRFQKRLNLPLSPASCRLVLSALPSDGRTLSTCSSRCLSIPQSLFSVEDKVEDIVDDTV